ncbi:MAG: flap endonuclease-1 [Thermofilaceae archaeon]|nr:flap endonuclease-1 [Thermofilaceae archaeon]MCX8179971.1 flap endonuclease-1 [Thermofilaceae archaeon]MDW8004724.1 flap endonuclease-1 [Thermofilaceae archaeon]
MGTNLTPLVERVRIGLKGLTGKTLAVDALNAIYQFLALVRDPRGGPMRNNRGMVTSHLIGLATRYSKLAYENGCKFVFVFDGPPHPFKKREIERRRETRRKAFEEYKKYVEAGDYERAFSKAVSSASVDEWVIESSKKLLTLMGYPVVEAPSDAEAQAAFITLRGDAWAVSSQDWDSLLYGAPKLVRYVTLTGFEWLPSKRVARRLEPELVELEKALKTLGLSRRQLVEVAILSGTDFNEGVKGIGPRKAYKLIKTYGSLDKLPASIRESLPEGYEELVDLFMNPQVREDYSLEFKEPDCEALYSFLVEENSFSPRRVNLIIERLRKSWDKRGLRQGVLEDFLA